MIDEPRNLLRETLEMLRSSGKNPSDVRWVGKSDGTLAVDWGTFALLAEHCEYDAGFGWNDVNESLVVVGDSWWLERGEYDGSEWWEFKTLPILKSNASAFDNVLLLKSSFEECWSKAEFDESVGSAE